MKKSKIFFYVSVVLNVVAVIVICTLLYKNQHKGGESKKAEGFNISSVEKAANAGDVKSIEDLMLYYLNKDNSRSRYWAEVGHEKGSILVTNNLASMYQYGIGGEKDENKAKALYVETSNKGSLIGLRKLGRLYLNLEPGEKSKGLDFLKSACQQGDKESCFIINN
ncbi:sel1 repeat family protein [Salmonella enterica subsp. enterica]|nr:sel1 repeat family protein [Salmonella enterica subsp. enterica]